jgi:hypothetical protein
MISCRKEDNRPLTVSEWVIGIILVIAVLGFFVLAGMAPIIILAKLGGW